MSGNQTTGPNENPNAPTMGVSPERLAGREQGALSGMVETQIDGAQVLVGVYASEQEARRAAGELESLGYGQENVRVLDESVVGTRAVADRLTPPHSQLAAEPEAERMEGEVEVGQVSKINLGTGVGLLAGAAAGAMLGLAALQMPGLSGLLAGNAAAAMAAGAVVFAGLGAWGGSLAGYGIPDEEAPDYTSELREGAWLVAVRTNRIDQALAVLRDFGARNLAEDSLVH